jgi:DNA modification methylase
LVSDLIRASTKPGDLVLDPFLGSGTTAVAAERTRRKWIGVESNPEYVKMACERLARMTSARTTPGTLPLLDDLE